MEIKMHLAIGMRYQLLYLLDQAYYAHTPPYPTQPNFPLVTPYLPIHGTLPI